LRAADPLELVSEGRSPFRAEDLVALASLLTELLRRADGIAE
jgi:hypothetical protein